MKVLLISSFFPPTRTGGTEKRTLGYAEALRESGHDVQVVCVRDWDEGDQYWNGYADETYRRIPVRRIDLNWSLAPDPNGFLYRNPLVEEQLGQWLENWEPDIVHVTSCLTLSASVIQAVKTRRLPVVLTLTDFWFVCPRVTLLRGDGSLCNGRTTSWECLKCMLGDANAYRRLRSVVPEKTMASALTWASREPRVNRLRGLRGMALDMTQRKSYLAEMLRAADCVTAPSECLSATLAECGASAPVRVIHSGHDLSWLATAPQKTHSKLVRIGYIGQVIPLKRVHLFVSAFQSAGLMDRAQAAIYGDHRKSPAYAEELEGLIGGCEGVVKLRGEFAHERLGDVLSEIDVLVVPSVWHENDPRVIQEAFASKTPVVAANVGGISEFVEHDVNGLLFERGDVGDLAKKLKRVVDEPSLLRRLRSGTPPVKTMGEEIAEFERIYRELTAA